MRYLEEKTSIVSTIIENQFPQHVQENNPLFLSFLSEYYKSQEGKYGPLDIAANLTDYYNITYFRPNRLVESVELTSNISDSDTTIPVFSTKGYPEKGYIKIDNEIIYYEDKTTNSFTNCVRGTKALVLSNIPKSLVTLETSVKASHLKKVNVYNIAYNYAKEFFNRIKSEIGFSIPEVLDESLDLGEFLKRIKSFYSAKGSLNSHRIVFRILFNDRRFDLKLKSRGSGAVLDIPNLDGSIPDPITFQIPDSVFIKNGGTGYDNRKTGSVLVNAPIVDIFGTGTGIVNQTTKIRDNTTAIIKVTDIDSNGTITNISVEDIGENYFGPIRARVRPTKFEEDQIVTNIDGTGIARVEYYEAKTDNLILYDVVGNFRQGQEIFSTSGEQPRAFISTLPHINFKTRKGVEILSEDQQIEFPREYTFKTSNTQSSTRKIIRCKLVEGYNLLNDTLPSVFSLKQKSDKLFGVKGVDIEVDNRIFLTDDIFEFEIGSNTDIDDIYLQPATVIVKAITIDSNTDIITVDDASSFPVSNGILSIKGKEIIYTSRSSQQFFGCSYTGTSFNVDVKDEVISFGRYKLIKRQEEDPENPGSNIEKNEWTTNVRISVGDYRFYNNNLYIAETSGISGSIAPSHTTGIVSDGKISWRYYDTNRYDHSFYIEQTPNPRFRVFGLPGDVVIDQSGSLNSLTKYEFANFDSPNIDVYNFKLDNELAADRSDRLALLLSSNYNRNRNTVTDSRLPSFGSLTGFNTHYDYTDHVYIATSCVPPWWSDIITYPGSGNIPANDLKKVSFTNQKAVCRWAKSAILYSTQGVSQFRKNKKLIGLQVDAIQANSYKGNTVQYGYVDRFSIALGGNYGVTYTESGGIATSFNDAKNPKLVLKEGTTTLNIDNSNNLTKISAGISKINFTKLFAEYTSELSGFTSKPSITVVNQNPQSVANFTNLSASGDSYPGINKTNNIVTSSSHGFKTGDKVKFISDDNYFQSLISNTDYFVRVLDDNTFTVHKTKSNALLNNSIVSLTPNYISPATALVPGVPVVQSNVTFRFEGEFKNPYTGSEDAVLEVGYGNGNIDNIVIRSSGKGYINLPKIVISNGGKSDFEIPFSKDGVKFVEMTGPLVSYHNFDNKNYNTILVNATGYASITNRWEKTPSAEFVSGRNATATAFLANGKLSSVVLSNAGEFYDIEPLVEVLGDGKDAVVTATITTSGEIEQFVIVNPGSGYTTAPTIKITPVGGGGKITTSLKEWTFNLVRQLGELGRIDNHGGYVFDNNDSIPGSTTIAQSITIDGSTTTITVKDTSTFPTSGVLSIKGNQITYTSISSTQFIGCSYVGGGFNVIIGDDVKSTSTNPKSFKLIDYKNDFPTDINQKQYFLLKPTEKLAARQIKNSAPDVLLGAIAAAAGKSVANLTDAEILGTTGTAIDQITAAAHSLPYLVSYDGIPTYYSGKLLQKRNVPLSSTNTLVESKSQYKLKYTTSATGDITETSKTIGGTTYYFSRVGGPSTADYPIGSFIEDYEFVEGDDNALDIHNGRFSVTPEFPNGRYIYAATRKSYDDATNAIVADSAIDFGGFPYFIGDTFASEYDDYMNNRCRTNDKIPKNFVRAYEKDVPKIVSTGDAKYFGSVPAGANWFNGLDHNDEYPKEDTDKIRSVAGTLAVSGGSVDSIILENKGSGYSVGDRLKVDNSKTFGSGFSGFVSKIGGKELFNSFLKTPDYKTVTFQTKVANELAIGDLIEFKYDTTGNDFSDSPIYLLENGTAQPISPNVVKLDNIEVSIRDGQSIDTLKDKLIYAVSLNAEFKYELQLPGNSEIKVTYDIESVNEYFTLVPSPTDTVRFDMTTLPNRVYLHVTSSGSTDEWIYQIDKVKGYAGSHTVVDVNSSLNQFTVEFPESTYSHEQRFLSYAAQSYGATGPIEEVTITGTGNNYRKLPQIVGLIKKGTTGDVAGDGTAILQTNSNSIGKIKRIYYDSIGTSFTSNNNVNYYLNLPATAKIINNFEIYDVEILNSGQNYDNVISILVDGASDKATIEATVRSGTITKVKVVDGGMNFSKEPVLTISSTTGTGGSLKAKIRRKDIPVNTELTGVINSILFPIEVKTKSVSFDTLTSVLEFDEVAGQYKENDIVYMGGKPYGKIVSIRRTKAYAKVNSYATLNVQRSDIQGNTSEFLQKITDSNYYQDWSYSLTSSRDINEWKKDQDTLTHPAGFKQFGKKRIERRKSVFKDQQEIFKSNVAFATKFFNKIDLKTELGRCDTQRLFFSDTSQFTAGDYYFGITSTAIGEIVDVTEFFIRVKNRNGTKFITNESIVKISLNYAIGLNPGTYKSVVIANGILQEPVESYDVSTDFLSVQSFIPRFELNVNDEILWHKLQTPFTDLDDQTLTASGTTFSLSEKSNAVTIDETTKEKFIISIAGSVQNPSNFTVSNNIVNVTNSPNYDSKVFAIKHNNLRQLTFTGSGTTYTLNYTPTSHCNLLIFVEGASQSQLLTDFTLSGNTVTFSEQFDVNELFGWEINETVTCEQINISDLLGLRTTMVLDCVTKRFAQNIESNAIKKPDSIYEIRKDQITGTVIPESSTLVTGFDTKFTYTTPRYSKSYVDVLDALTFDGSTKSFTLQKNGENHTPRNGEESLIIQTNIGGTKHVLDHTEYTVSGSTITFNTAYAASVKLTILDYESTFLSNVSNESGSVLDRLFTKLDGSRRTFSVSDAGVPIYSKNVGDIFTIKNGKLLSPDSSQHSITDNKITFVDAPTSSDSVVLTHFNRQLLPDYTNNVVLDDFVCADGVRTDFPITLPGAARGSIPWNNINHIFIVRNGVYQKPGVDFTLVNQNIIRFATAPTKEESGLIFGYVSQANATQNLLLDDLTGFNGSTTTFNLTHSGGTAFTPPDVDDLFVIRNGVLQNPTQDYTSSGSTITFTTAPANTEYVWILYTHNASELTISSSGAVSSSVHRYTLSSAISANDHDEVVIIADGVPRFSRKNDFTVQNNGLELHLTHTDGIVPQSVFVMKYANVTLINDLEECQDGSRTTFRVLNNGQDAIDALTQPDDVLVAKNGIVLQKDVDYTISAVSDITFTTAPLHTDNILLIRSDGMVHSTLTNTSGNTYTISNSETTEKSNVVVFSNNQFKFEELGDFTWVNDSTITLSSAHTTGNLFAIKFDGIFKLLDPINNIFNGSNTKFNLMDGQKFLTPTAATYTASTGNLVLTIANHGLSAGNVVKIAANSLSFTCSMDNNYSVKTYPRTTDPVYGNNITIGSVTTNTITLPIGASPLVNYTPGSNTEYNTVTGDLILDIGTSGAAARYVGEQIKLTNGALTFTCASDGNQTQLSHPRALIDPYTPESATYNSSTGIVTITLSGHGFVNDDWVKLEDNALTFTCTKDSNGSNHAYPRSTDPISGKFIQISNVTTNTFDINVGISPAGEQYPHTFVSAVADSLKKKRDRHDTPLVITAIDATAGTITVNVGPSPETAPHTFVSALSNSVITGGNYTHTFVSAKPRSLIIGNTQENFVPVGTTSNDNVPHETGIIVVKNGSVLDPGVDYTLTGDIKSQISLTTAPASSDVMSVRAVGMFDKLDTITNGSGTTFSITKGSTAYYANNDIDRPEKLENQIMVIMDGNVQSPLYDYVIRHDKIVFESSVTFTKLVLLDFRGTPSDVQTISRSYDVSVGDQLYIDGEVSPRTVTSVKSPDVLITNSYTGTTPSGYVGTSTPTNGKLSTITSTANGLNYKEPVIMRTVGTGVGAKFLGTTNYNEGGTVTPGDLLYPGRNIQNPHDVYATVYASVYKELPISKTEIRRSTKLDADINATVETVALDNVSGLSANTPTITIAGGGSSAVLRPYVSNGKIRKVEIVNGGSGYNDKDFSLTLTGGGGSGCVLRGTLNATGTITAVDVVNSGTGYDTNRVILYQTSGGVVTSEVIEYTELSATSGTANLLGCTRGAAGTTAVPHSAQIESPDNASTYTLVYFDNFL